MQKKSIKIKVEKEQNPYHTWKDRTNTIKPLGL